MINQIDQKECCGCGACVQVCPMDCINIEQNIEGFYYPKLDSAKCIKCKKCINTCPVNQKEISVLPKDKILKAYAGYNTNLIEQYSSSSGGIFVLLAELVIEKGGVVFGAAFGQDFQVKHMCAESKEQLKYLKGSKYVQSYTGNTFIKAKNYLQDKRLVLFSGTPCQIEGLLHFLGKAYENLITVDLFCTGVPSPGIWSDYLNYRKEQAYAKKPTCINFRNKASGWEDYRVCFSFDNGIEYSKGSKEDIYMKGFISGAFLQQACYNCKFKNIERNSDLTLGDFWGVKKEQPECYNTYGVSAIIVQSEKGEKLLKKLDKAWLKEVPVESILKGNRNALRSITALARREIFFDCYTKRKLSLAESVQTAVGQDIGTGRLRQYFNLFKQWIENLQNKKFLYDKLSQMGAYRVGLIGLGDIGKRLKEELELDNSNIKICYILDENDTRFIEHLKEVKTKPCDLIIICSFVSFYELKEHLLRAGYNREIIVSLKELVF